MEVLRDSTVVTDTASATIPGPYISPERTESIPLKGTTASSSNFLSRCCLNCLGFADDDVGDGLKFIKVTFFILSVAVTIALVAQIYHGDYQVVPHGSVATDSINCSTIGTDILKLKGNAVDAAVASTLCMGVANPHITGLGGGGFILVYDHRKREILESLDFREAAPHNVPLVLHETAGPATVGVPGLVSGLFAAHKAHGKLSWQEVVQPAANFARSGFLVPSSLVAARNQLPPRSDYNAMLHDLVGTLEAGQILKLPQLAATLDLLATEGPDAFYNGTISKEILAAVQGSSLTASDLASYKPVQREALHETFYGFDIIVPGAPSGGPLLLAALQSLYGLNLTAIAADEPAPLLLYRQAQAIQQNYATFFAESGDPDFSSAPTQGPVSSSLPETVASHVASVDLNDLYVSVVSGHNSLFGSQVLTEGGFLLNNALASFDMSSSPIYKSAAINPSSSDIRTLPSEPGSHLTYSGSPNTPDDAKILDHLAVTGSLIDAASPDSSIGTKEVNPSPKYTTLGQVPQPTGFSKRFKRSVTFEPGPRATVWGSSVANNYIVGGKRPISLSTPIIAIERGLICGRRLILGGSDAGVAAQVLSQLVVLDGNLTSSIEYPRIRFSPSGSNLHLEQSYAAGLSPARRQQLTDLGLQMQSPSAINPSVNIVEKIGDVLVSRSDSRGEGVASRF